MLKNGELGYPLPNPIWKGAISDWLEQSRNRLYRQVLNELGDRWSPEEDDEGFPGAFYDHFLERLLFNIRNLGHGGTLVLVPDDVDRMVQPLTDLIAFKYKTTFEYAWHFLVKFLVNEHDQESLYTQLSRGEELTLGNFHRSNSLSMQGSEIYEKIQDIAKTIASLTSVDGAVAITTQFRVLGFGGEILTNDSSLSHVVHPSESLKITPIESLGTRHRSAFRFCYSLEDSVAFIFSSDGGVKATKRVGNELHYWPKIIEGALGL